MSKRKIDNKIETVIPELNMRKSRRKDNLLAVKVENVKIEKSVVRTYKNNSSSLIEDDKIQTRECRRSSRLKENISPNYGDQIMSKIPKAIKILNNSLTKLPKIQDDNNTDTAKNQSELKIDIKNLKRIDVKKQKELKSVKKQKTKADDIEIPIDRECKSKLGNASIFVDGNDVYDVMLNQTNLQFNNNKFYLIQLLKDNSKDSYSVWMRWARVGKIGQNKLTSFASNLEGAIKCFSDKFYDKTKNHWEDRFDFEKIDGKYDLVHIDYVKRESILPKKEETAVKLEPLECKLNEKLQNLLRIIFDIKEMNSAVSDLNYDADRLPLGRLTEDQIKVGYKALREIEGLLNEGYSSNSKLLAACNAYYTRIPHDFGMRPPPIIRSLVDIKKELELLETLSDIRITLGLMEMGDINVHYLDRQYQSLKCDIRSVSASEDIYGLLNNYLIKTHGNTHKDYSLEMLELFEVKKEQEWKDFEDVGNKMLLWHGSRTTNYGGILSQGLRIAPPEAPVTGHMFGKGVYFSDISSKSANYVYCTRSKNEGFMLLCEVSLGKCNELTKADSRASRLPKDCHSVMGRGMITPDQSSWITTEDGVVVPVGEPKDTGLSEQHKGYLLNYNEYIVYNRNQIRMRYMMKIKFNYK